MKNFQHLTLLFLMFSLSILKGNAQMLSTNPKNEFRAVWIATVANIDWPVSNTDNVEKQKADFIAILDTYKKLNYNAVIVQIRSVGDAFYPSNFSPWSKYLTGKEGQAPKPYYDPLAWMIAETHARGFEFHAWLNPYRATMDLKTENLSPKHDYFQHPEWMIKYGDKYYYNPALPDVQNRLIAVVDEVVKNYDIDAIHFDDYFYPYKIKGEVFNDTAAFEKFGKGQNIDNWRRSNVNTLIKNISVAIKNSKPWVQFGISPFGVWRNKSVDPKGSETEAGQTNYDDLYADPLAWMENNWIDYLVPQLYWSIDHPKASYSKLLRWWSENSKNTAIYIGNGTYKINADSDKKWSNPNEIPDQINITRTYKNVQGNAFFSAKSFWNKNLNVSQILKENQYKYPALPNVVPNLIRKVAAIPVVKTTSKNAISSSFTVKSPLNNSIRYVMVYGAIGNSKIDINDPKQIIEKIAFMDKNNSVDIVIPTNKLDKNNCCAITFIDFFGNESDATLVKFTL